MKIPSRPLLYAFSLMTAVVAVGCTKSQSTDASLAGDASDDELRRRDHTPPAEVSNLTATATGDSITLTWTDPADKDFYRVRITYNGSSNTININKGVQTETFRGLSQGVEYLFTIKTVDTRGNASKGLTASAIPGATPPTDPPPTTPPPTTPPTPPPTTPPPPPTTPPPTTPPPTTPPPTSANFWIAPNHPAYHWGDPGPADVPWAHITHLALGYMWINPVKTAKGYAPIYAPGYLGDITNNDANVAKAFHDDALDYANEAHRRGKKVFMMLGGAKSNVNDTDPPRPYGNTWNVATSPSNIDAFATNVVAEFQSMGMDGIEIDWEENINYAQMVALAKVIRSKWQTAIITIDTMPVPSDTSDADWVTLASVKDIVDGYMPMTFLDIGQYGGWVLPSPLSPIDGYPGNGYSIKENMAAWTKVGVPMSKVILGVGGYGSVWGDNSAALDADDPDSKDPTGPIAPYANASNPNSNPSGERFSLYSDNIVTQSWVTNVLKANPSKWTKSWDSRCQCHYWHTSATNQLVTLTVPYHDPIKASLIFYESPESMAAKLTYANSIKMLGMNFWVLQELRDTDGSYPLLNAVMP